MEFVCFAVSLLSSPCIAHCCSDAEPIDGTQHTARRTAGVSVSYEGWNFNSGNYLFTTDTK